MLYTKHRPSKLEDLVGQKTVVDTLTSLFKKPLSECPQVYLLQGGSGTGKTTTAHIIKEHFGVHEMSFQEINGADKNGVADARQLVESFSIQPMYGDKTLILLDECHMLTLQAWNQLLTPLENLPEHVIVVLATSEPKKVIGAIKKGRTQTLTFKPLVPKVLGPMLVGICKKEKTKVDKEVLQAIVKKADGSARWAITILESVLDVAEEDRMGIVQDSVDSDDSDEFRALLDCILTHATWDKMSGVLSKFKDEPEATRYKILYHLGNKMIEDDYSTGHIRDCISFFEETFDFSGRAGFIGACYDCSNG